MKILIATGVFPPDIGGPATYVEKLGHELSRCNFDILIITYSDLSNSKSEITHCSTQQNLKIKVIKISRKYPKGLRHFLYFWKLLFAARDADVIYAQNATSAGLPALVVAKLLRKKLILKVVGDAAWEQGKPHLKKIQQMVVKGASQIIVPSQYVKKMVIGWARAAEKVNVIYNAVEISDQPDISKQKAKKKIGLDGNIILSVGRLVPWKGFEDLVAVMPYLLKENPKFKLVIVGEGEKMMDLKSQISHSGLQERIYLPGGISHEDIPYYFKAADIFILNSGYEGLSHTILEAMQQGVPVIASNIGGNPELIEDGINGLLVEYKNRNQIKQAILKLWQDPVLQEKFVQNSKQKLKQFNWENLVEKTLAILKS